MITSSDRSQLAAKGISEAQLNSQLKSFVDGFPYLRLSAAASLEKGINAPDENERKAYLAAWDAYCAEQHGIEKFVPASGAASRMFKDVFAFVDADYSIPTTETEKNFFGNIRTGAFYPDLCEACTRIYGKDVEALLGEERYKDVARAMLGVEGLAYGKLPKGLLKFHAYPEGARTPFEEHLAEGAQYANQQGVVKVHFTVSPEHRPLFEALAATAAERMGAAKGVRYEISFSEQKASTDTVAATSDNQPFRNADGSLLFRPGGHGALIENLSDIDADVIFVKNIDNVVPERLQPATIESKKLLAGVLVTLQKQCFAYLEKLDSGRYSMDDLLEMLHFVQKQLCCKNPETKFLEDTELAIYLRKKLHRPIRVCGMVRNVGAPGGGPYLTYNADGTVSLQILESSQIDMNDSESKAMFEGSTHFNPVDLVCGVRDYKGEKFNLPDYVDPATGFISHKSKDGRELKALELPGLWNGAMSDWNTVFVEIPLEVFNPVKTVVDLYLPEHQGA